MVSRDYENPFRVLNAHKIKYLVVGAHAVIYYTKPRFTKDIDIWIPPDLNDPKMVYVALKKFGAPLKGISPSDFRDKELIYQIGVAPVRIDILMNIQGVSSREAWKKRKKSRYGKTAISILAADDLVRSKEKAARPEDLLDLKRLRRRNTYNR